jgi:hypothetical protein
LPPGMSVDKVHAGIAVALKQIAASPGRPAGTW